MCGAPHIFLNIWWLQTTDLTIYCTVICISCQYLLQSLTFIELCTMASVMPNYGWMPSVATGCCKNRVSGSCSVKYKYKLLLVSWCAECCIVHTVRGFKRNKQTKKMATGDLQIRYVPSHFANKLLRIGIFSATIHYHSVLLWDGSKNAFYGPAVSWSGSVQDKNI